MKYPEVQTKKASDKIAKSKAISKDAKSKAISKDAKSKAISKDAKPELNWDLRVHLRAHFEEALAHLEKQKEYSERQIQAVKDLRKEQFSY